MPAGRSDLADLTYFLAIAKHRSFRRAGHELGVSASAMSHAMRGLEARLGVRLLNRTSRSVTLSAAGEQLASAIGTPFQAIDRAVEELNRFRDIPAGRIRLNVALDAVSLLLAPVLPVFVERYPEVEVEIVASNRMIDVIGSGFDAGIRYGGTVPEDMVAQRLSADIRWAVVGSPAYLERFGTPETPADLERHRCIRLRAGDDRLYRWEFEGPDGEFDCAVPGTLTVNDARLGIALACDDTGLTYGPIQAFEGAIADGRLKVVLADWQTTGAGFHIYYSSRHQVPTGLRLLINLIRELRPLGW